MLTIIFFTRFVILYVKKKKIGSVGRITASTIQSK